MARRSPGGDEDGDSVIVRRRGWQRIAAIAALGLILLFLLAIAGLWIARRPIAGEVLQRQFEQRGVQATYDLDRVGLRTQQISNLVIGDPKDPDLVARHALIQLRWTLAGSVRVYRIVARGVRLEGKVVNGRVVWGEVSKLLPPPTDKPFELPNIVIDVADTSISLQTPAGPLGFSLAGAGNLTGGFKGVLAASSPHLIFGRCFAHAFHAHTNIEVVARSPHVDGPFVAQQFACPASNFEMDSPRFDLNSRFNESFTRFQGRGQMATPRLVAGANGLAALTGNIDFKGTLDTVAGSIDAAAQRSRLGPMSAERTRVQGRYLLGAEAGTLAMIGEYSAQDAGLAKSVLAGVTEPLAAARGTPLGQIATAIGTAIDRTASKFDAAGDIRIVNFPGGGAARIESANVRTDAGARARVSGGEGVTYYWPSGRLRIDGLIQMAGGGLPTGQVLLRQPRPGGPLNGVARIAPYSAGESRLALAPIRFSATAGGATEFDTVALLDAPFPDGRVAGLRLPLNGRLGAGGRFTVGQSCVVASWRFFQMGEFQFGPTRLPLCPIGPAIVSQGPGGELRMAATTNNLSLDGRLGKSPLGVRADTARFVGKDFAFTDMGLRLGDPDAPVAFNADRLQGTFSGRGITGTFADATSTIGNIPLLVSEADGRWDFRRGDLNVDGSLTLTDRGEDPPRFYALRSNDFSVRIGGKDVRAGGTLFHPESGVKISDVTIRHDLASGTGGAILDVPGITFGANLQPEEITRLTEGVIALVQGTVSGQGRINWSGKGNVTSTGDFQTANMDLAAPFGPVTGLSTSVHFTDLLALETAPGQVAAVRSINPGIPVENGVIRYQLLRNQLVKVERGSWPFMGGQLVLQETILNFGRPSAKRLTFQLIGFEAKQFVDSLGFEGLEITGTFDGVLPMIFDESGGRIVGGRLDSRLPGGHFAYTGPRPKAGLAAGIAFDLLSDIHYRSMIIRLDGDLAGEFATRFTISDLSLGARKGGFISGLVRNALRKVPLRVNLNIKGPFRALIQTAKGFRDPTAVIAPVMPFPIDAPGIVTETRTIEKDADQTQTQPPAEQVTPSTHPPTASER